MCHPEGWVEQASQTINERYLAGSEARLTLTVREDPDHAQAIATASEFARLQCTGTNATVDVLEIDGWPGVLQQYATEPAMCGACQDPPETGLDVHVILDVVVDRYVLHVTTLMRDPDENVLQLVRAVMSSTTISSDQVPVDTASDLATIAEAARCE